MLMETYEFYIPDGKKVRLNKFLLRLALIFTSKIFVGRNARSLPYYVFKCAKHGYQLDYPHGYEERIECMLCWSERLKKDQSG